MAETDFAYSIRLPTTKRPLLGLTVLVVEDSRYACETLRLMCLRSGARIRRADSLASAHKHLKVYRPSVAVIDLGLPDGSGLSLIEELHHASPRISVILAMSAIFGGDNDALQKGADAYLAKPFDSLKTFQNEILNHLPKDRQPLGSRAMPDDVIKPDPIAYWDDISHAMALLNDADDPKVMAYVFQFLSGVARSAEDHELVGTVSELSNQGTGLQPAQLSHLMGLLDNRMGQAKAI